MSLPADGGNYYTSLPGSVDVFQSNGEPAAGLYYSIGNGEGEVPLPKLVLAAKPTLEMTFEDVALEGYQHHPFIKFPVAV